MDIKRKVWEYLYVTFFNITKIVKICESQESYSKNIHKLFLYKTEYIWKNKITQAEKITSIWICESWSISRSYFWDDDNDENERDRRGDRSSTRQHRREREKEREREKGKGNENERAGGLCGQLFPRLAPPAPSLLVRARHISWKERDGHRKNSTLDDVAFSLPISLQLMNYLGR